MNVLTAIEWLLAATRSNVKLVRVDPSRGTGVISTADLDYQVKRDKKGHVVVGETIRFDNLDEAEQWMED